MPEKPDRLRHGPLGRHTAHLCVDMQRMYDEPTPWHTPWMRRVVPNIRRLVAAHPARTIFTRFIPAEHPGEGNGTWRRYYERWADMTVERLGPGMLELVPELASFVPPATCIDKRAYSPWFETGLACELAARGVDSLVVSGGETDVCVLAAVLGAIDRGYRVVIVADALCSSSDETHDSLMTVYESRYGQQVETVTTDAVLAAWPPEAAD